jgi:parallel beta-helix repeat protein
MLLVFAVLCAASFDASARDLWVDKLSKGGACSDARAATAVTKTAPLCTLGAAAKIVAAGDLVHVRGATYNEPTTCSGCEGRAVLQLIRPGTATAWIRFVAEPGETAILEGSATATMGVRAAVFGTVLPSFNEVRGFVIHKFALDCINVTNVPDIRIASVDVSACTRGAVELHGAQRVTLQNSVVHDNNTTGWTSAVDLYQCKDGNLISGNRIYNNSDSAPGQPDSEGHGIIMDYCPGGASTNTIENNLIYNNEGWCMVVLNSIGATIRNNVCYHNAIRNDGSGEISEIGNNVSVYNNILVPRTGKLALNMRYSRSDFTSNLATVSENNNLLDVSATAVSVGWGPSIGTLAQYKAANGHGWGPADFTGNPLFVDEFGFNFHLQASSPAIDRGNTAKAPLYDFDGHPRPSGAAADIGAYEVSAGATLTGSVVASLTSTNLTNIGTKDWAKWPGYVHKSAGGSQISNVSAIGTEGILNYTGDPRLMTWADGAPTASGTDSAGIYLKNNGSGFHVTAPADTTLRTLVVYAGGWVSGGKLVARLSDNSIADYVHTYSATAHYGLVYTFTYKAASAGQKLIVEWTKTSGTGTIQLQSAAMH